MLRAPSRSARHELRALIGIFAVTLQTAYMKMVRWLVLLAAGCTEGAAPEAPPPPPEPPEAVEPAPGTTPDTRDHADADGVVRRGVAVGASEAISVSEAITRADELDGETIELTGEVEAACSKKGCWMVVTNDDAQVRVTMKDYGFFVPSKSPGMSARVRGAFSVETMSVEDAQHLEDDRVAGTDEPPRTITEPVREATIVASGLELRPST